jgi:hypothetical protein
MAHSRHGAWPCKLGASPSGQKQLPGHAQGGVAPPCWGSSTARPRCTPVPDPITPSRSLGLERGDRRKARVHRGIAAVHACTRGVQCTNSARALARPNEYALRRFLIPALPHARHVARGRQAKQARERTQAAKEGRNDWQVCILEGKGGDPLSK